MNSSISKGILLLFAGLISAFLMQAQEPVKVERSSNKVILGGKVYFIHTVEPGQTLYSISKAYQVSVKEITLENPGVVSGLIIGQTLKIPAEPGSGYEIDTSGQEQAGSAVQTHRVKRGETFYSISRMYGVSEQAVREANPSIDPEELSPGMRLVVPGKAEEEHTDQEPVYNEEGFAYHRVKRRETFYSIARYYGVSVPDLREANPEVGWGGPKEGQVIRIPLPMVGENPESARDTLPPDSGFFSFGREDQRDYAYDELMASHDNRRRLYRVAFLIPFNFTPQEPLDSLLKDVKSASRRNRIIERYRIEQKVPQSVPFLEFFQGSLLALDSLRKTGMKLDVRFYDTKKSMETTRTILDDPEMEDMDLIIGPFYPFNLDIVSDFAKHHRIPVVTPFFSEMTYVWDNPYLFQPSPSLEEGYREMAKLVASKHDYNIVYVREEDSLDFEKHEMLKEMIFDGFDDYRPENPVVFKEMVLTLDHTDEIIQSLSPDMKNLVVVPTRNEALASRVVSALYYRLKDFDIEVLGTAYWTEFSSIETRYFHELNLVFCNPFWVDYLDPKVDAYFRLYRDYFYTEPSATTKKGINYGIAGFDMTMYFVNALKIYGRRFILSLDEYHPKMILEPYRFSRFSSAGGYENTAAVFYQFHPDMTIGRIAVPDLPQRGFFFRSMDDRKPGYLIDRIHY